MHWFCNLQSALFFGRNSKLKDDGSNGFWGLVGSCNFVVARYLLPKSVSQTSKQKTSNKIHRHSYHTYTVTFTHTFYYSIYIYSIKKKNLMSPTTKSRYPQGNQKKHPFHVDVSKNSGTPESSILIRFSIINHPFWGTPHTPIFGKTHESFHDPIPPSALAPRDVGPLPSYVLPRSAGAAAPAKTWVQRWEVLSDNKFLEANFWKFQWFKNTLNVYSWEWQFLCQDVILWFDFCSVSLMWLLYSSDTIITLIHSLPP